MAFPGCLNDSKSSQVTRTLLSILTDLNHAVVWIVSTRPPIFNSSSSRSKRSTHKWYQRYTHVPQLSKFSSKVHVLVSLFIFFEFHSVVRRDCKLLYTASFIFLLIITRSGPIWIIFKVIWAIDGTLIATKTPGQSEPGSNGNEVYLTYLSGCM